MRCTVRTHTHVDRGTLTTWTNTVRPGRERNKKKRGSEGEREREKGSGRGRTSERRVGAREERWGGPTKKTVQGVHRRNEGAFVRVPARVHTRALSLARCRPVYTHVTHTFTYDHPRKIRSITRTQRQHAVTHTRRAEPRTRGEYAPTPSSTFTKIQKRGYTKTDRVRR